MSPSIKIDYIYAKKGAGVKLIETGVDRQRLLSDHFPIYADVEIK